MFGSKCRISELESSSDSELDPRLETISLTDSLCASVEFFEYLINNLLALKVPVTDGTGSEIFATAAGAVNSEAANESTTNADAFLAKRNLESITVTNIRCFFGKRHPHFR